MSRVKVAIIGAGSMANRFHVPSLATFEDVELCAVCDPVAQNAAATAERFAIPRVFTDHRQMLAETKPDAVYVLVPPQFTFDLVVLCLREGKHVFVEKPPGLTARQSEALAYHA